MGLTEHLNTKSSVAKRGKSLAKRYEAVRQSWIAANPRCGRWKLGELSKKSGTPSVKCVCECGAKNTVLLKDLKKGKSTGCRQCSNRKPPVYLTEEAKKLAKAVNQWKVRCCWAEAENYAYYGGRGIKFKFKTIEAAVTWVKENIGYPPAGMSIDRIDNERHYEPGNLRWATKSEQMLNRRAWAWSKSARLRHYKLRAKK
jgi:hypothetical protein